MKAWLAGIGMWLCVGVVSAGESPQEPVPFKANARVVVDGSGVPLQVEASRKLPEQIRQAVEERVMQWRFEPVVIDGTPRTGVTHVFLEACAVPLDGGRLNIAMNYSWNGPGYPDGELRQAVPAFPREALHDGIEGSFRVIMKVGADGAVAVESIERKRGVLRLFEPALRAWAEALRYVPEEVEGVPVATRISIPVDFTLGRPAYGKEERERRAAKAQATRACATASQGAEQSYPVVLDSPFRPRSTG